MELVKKISSIKYIIVLQLKCYLFHLYYIDEWYSCQNTCWITHWATRDKNLFFEKQKLAFQNEELYLTINSEQLQHSACEKLLGIKIDSNLNWKNQIDQVCSKISSKIYLLSKIKKYLNLESRQLFYSGYILPLIDYCCVVWGNCSNEGLNRILKLQKRTARLILDQDPIAPSELLFKQLGWMSIEQRIKYHKYLLVSKCLKNEAPIYLKNKIQYLSDRNS